MILSLRYALSAGLDSRIPKATVERMNSELLSSAKKYCTGVPRQIFYPSVKGILLLVFLHLSAIQHLLIQRFLLYCRQRPWSILHTVMSKPNNIYCSFSGLLLVDVFSTGGFVPAALTEYYNTLALHIPSICSWSHRRLCSNISVVLQWYPRMYCTNWKCLWIRKLLGPSLFNKNSLLHASRNIIPVLPIYRKIPVIHRLRTLLYSH